MKVRDAKAAARDWIAANRADWPGLQAAHLVGGITSLPDDDPFPAHKDVDLHLVFADGSPMLVDGPWFGILAAPFRGLAIEAGIKAAVDYRSPDAVLANPEVAHHLLGDAVLFDPEGMLGDLLPSVRRDYPRRHWVAARLAHERRGQEAAFAALPEVRMTHGAPAEVNLMGYLTTFPTAALAVARLEPPKLGSRSLVRLRKMLSEHGRADLHAAVLATTGLDRLTPADARRLLAEALEAFDLAVALPPRPRPFGHKLHAHLRPLLAEGCRAAIEEGDHREGSGWVVATHAAATDAVLTDGPEEVRPRFAARRDAMLDVLGMAPEAARDAAIAAARYAYAEVFSLADAIAGAHPRVVD